MCGIFGFYGSDMNRLQKMAYAMRMRGPDDMAFYMDDKVSLGMVRLAIVDRQKGKQPFVSENGNIIVFYNGEIYNWNDLILPMHTYNTDCDGEVLPHLYEEYGGNFVDYLRGMYAICVYQKDIGKYSLFRDPAGVKPLYNSPRGFASTTNALYKRGIDSTSIEVYRGFGHAPHDTVYCSGIEAVPTAKRGRIWRTMGLEQEFCNAVKMRMVADRVPGLFLSGGLDSTTVLHEMVKHVSDPALINTFTLCYTDSIPGKDADRAMAAQMAKYYSTTHHEVSISSDDVWDALPDIALAFDQPFAGCISTWFLAREAKKTVDCVLTGDGADELFGSYLVHRIAAQKPTVPISRWRKGFLGNGRTCRIEDMLLDIDTTEGDDALAKLLRWEWENTFQLGVLAFSDILSMSHALEIRSPFVDRFVVQEAFALPSNEKINLGSTKVALHQLATKLGVPPQVICRAKEGFVQPSLYWLKTKWKDRVMAINNSDVKSVAEKYYSGREDLGMDLWREINLHIWREECNV